MTAAALLAAFTVVNSLVLAWVVAFCAFRLISLL